MDYTTALTLLGGLGLFLFGIHVMGEGLEQAAGSKMKKLIEVLTKNKFLAVLVGALVTGVIQSSSATTVMVVGFVNAGLLRLSDAIGLIMGANIGTTVTSLMLSVELDFGMIFAGLGGILLLLGSKGKLRIYGQVLLGLGVLFVGMETMTAAMKPLRTWDGFVNMMQMATNPIIGVLVGAFITALLQSSSASIGILQALASTGVISLQASMFILFGQNIGTCVTALIASAGTSKTAKRAAFIHLMFNVLGSLLFIFIAIILPLDVWVQSMAGNNLRLQISFTHIIFNITTTLLLLPLSSVMEKLSYVFVRGVEEEEEKMHLRFFDPLMLSTPPIAAQQLFNEVLRMAKLTLRNYKKSIVFFFEPSKIQAKEFDNCEEVIDYLNEEITHYLIELRGMALPDKDVHMLGSMFHVVNDLERIGDHANNIKELSEKAAKNDVKFSQEAKDEIEKLSTIIEEMIQKSTEIVRDQANDKAVVNKVLTLEGEVNALCESYSNTHNQRLNERKCSTKNAMMFLDMLYNLERIGDHAENLATSVDDWVLKQRLLW